jgi:hypothetical protein
MMKAPPASSIHITTAEHNGTQTWAVTRVPATLQQHKWTLHRSSVKSDHPLARTDNLSGPLIHFQGSTMCFVILVTEAQNEIKRLIFDTILARSSAYSPSTHASYLGETLGASTPVPSNKHRQGHRHSRMGRRHCILYLGVLFPHRRFQMDRLDNIFLKTN